MDDSCVLRGGGCRTHSIAVATFGFGQGFVARARRIQCTSLNGLRRLRFAQKKDRLAPVHPRSAEIPST